MLLKNFWSPLLLSGRGLALRAVESMPRPAPPAVPVAELPPTDLLPAETLPAYSYENDAVREQWEQKIRVRPLANDTGLLVNEALMPTAVVREQRDDDGARDDDAQTDRTLTLTPPPRGMKKTSKSMASELTSFTLPLLLVWLSSPLLSLADSAFVGAFRSTAELAALGPGCSLCDSAYLMAYFVSVVTTSAVATARAKGDAVSARAATAAGVLAALSVGAGLTLTLSGLNAGAPLLAAASGSSQFTVDAANYVRHRCLGFAPALMSSALQAASLARRDVRPAVVAAGAASLANLVGDALLVPHFGLVGAADATALAQIVSLAVVWKAAASKRYFDVVFVDSAKKTRAFFKDVFVDGLPILATLVAKTAVCSGLAFSATKSAVLRGNIADAAAHQILASLYFLFAPVGDALASTVQTFGTASLASSSSDETKKKVVVVNEGTRAVVKGACKAALFLGLVDALLAFVLPSCHAGLFTRDSHVVASLAACAPALGLSLLFHGASSAFEGALLAVRDAKRLGLLYALDAAAVICVFAALAAQGAALPQIWAVYVAYQVLRATQFGLRAKALVFGEPLEAAAARPPQREPRPEEDLVTKRSPLKKPLASYDFLVSVVTKRRAERRFAPVQEPQVAYS